MSDNNIKKKLDEEIERQIDDLSRFDAGSDEKTTAINELVKLHNLRIEEMKMELEFTDRTEKREMDLDVHDKEMEFKERQFEEDCKVHERTGRNDEKKLAEVRKDRYFNLGIKALEISLPLVFYAVWMKAGFKFEQEGVFTSTTFKELFKNFRPKK